MAIHVLVSEYQALSFVILHIIPMVNHAISFIATYWRSVGANVTSTSLNVLEKSLKMAFGDVVRLMQSRMVIALGIMILNSLSLSNLSNFE
jgi:hypothetical protein